MTRREKTGYSEEVQARNRLAVLLQSLKLLGQPPKKKRGRPPKKRPLEAADEPAEAIAAPSTTGSECAAAHEPAAGALGADREDNVEGADGGSLVRADGSSAGSGGSLAGADDSSARADCSSAGADDSSAGAGGSSAGAGGSSAGADDSSAGADCSSARADDLSVRADDSSRSSNDVCEDASVPGVSERAGETSV